MINPSEYLMLAEKIKEIHDSLDNMKIDIAIIKSDVAATKENTIKTNGRVNRAEDAISKITIDQATHKVHFDNNVEDNEKHRAMVEKYFFWGVTSIVGTFIVLLFNTVTKVL